MKIKRVLLLGEFSSVHLNLRDGLRELGVDAKVASTGDGFKNYDRDINLGSDQKLPKIIRYPKFVLSSFLKSPAFINNDVVQTISPVLFPDFVNLHNWFTKNIIKNRNGSFFYNAAGADTIVFKGYHAGLFKDFRYNPFDEIRKDDVNSGRDKAQSEEPELIKAQADTIKYVDGIITNCYEYYLPYKKLMPEKWIGHLHFPVNLAKHKYEENTVRNKVKIFHGINNGRENFKGSFKVMEVLEKIKHDFKDEVEITIVRSLPFSKFIAKVKDANIIIDQINSYDTGMAALQAMAMGKVVISGAEPAALTMKGVKDVPYYNGTPVGNELYTLLSGLIINKQAIPEIGFKARDFISENNDYVKVASDYLKLWETRLVDTKPKLNHSNML